VYYSPNTVNDELKDEVGKKFIQCFICNTGKRGPNRQLSVVV